MIDPDRPEASQDVQSSQSCYEAMKSCLDELVKTDRLLLERLNTHCRLQIVPVVIFTSDAMLQMNITVATSPQPFQYFDVVGWAIGRVLLY